MCKTGVTQWFLNCPQGPESLKLAQEFNFHCIHINAGLPTDQWYLGMPEVENTYRKMIEKYEIAITAISINLIEEKGLLISPSFHLEAELQQMIRDVIFAAKRMGVGLVYFPSFNHSQIKDQSDFNKTVKILQFACDVAHTSRVLIATENTLSAKENAELIQKVNRTNLKVLLDTLNPILYGHSVIEFIDTLFPFIADQVHVKDGTKGEMGNARLGNGIACLQETFVSLYERDFKGSFILENDYRENGNDNIVQDLSFLSKMNREIFCKRRYAPN